jgi:hypothetical protein
MRKLIFLAAVLALGSLCLAMTRSLAGVDIGGGHFAHFGGHGPGSHFGGELRSRVFAGGHDRRFRHGRWWGYGVGPCWKWSDAYGKYAWVRG